jgi:hypothetical protein
MTARRTRLALASTIVAAMTLASCSQTSQSAARHVPQPKGSSPAIAAARLGAPGCHPTSPMFASSTGLRQTEGTGHNASLWALLFFGGSPRVDRQVKIAWRMTGTGPFRLAAVGPGGLRLRPAWGPEVHDGSNWNKPGDEWGTGFTFTEPGCWDLHAVRTDSHADVWLEVTNA